MPPEPLPRLAVALDKVRSRHNVGAIFRTADAAGVSKIYLTGYTPTPPHARIAKVSLGAEAFVLWEKHTQLWRLIKKLRAQGVIIAALENNVPGAQSIFQFKRPHRPVLLILGSETNGLSKSILGSVDFILTIPMRGQKESLNVSVAFGIAAYQLTH